MSKEKWFHVEEPNELTRFGYAVDKSPEQRHGALDKAIISERNSGLEVFHKLMGLSNVNKSKQEKHSMIYHADANYVKKKFMNTEYW